MLLERYNLMMASPSATSLPRLQQPTKYIASSSLKEVLQSDPVRRLFSQPNIVIHAIPRTNSPTAYRVIQPKCVDEKNVVNGEHHSPKKADVSIDVENTPNKETSEIETLLPSKNNEKSEIILVPVVRSRKECGHFEPCESLVCDVIVQQYDDNETITPLISVNIDEDEIDVTVARHCENKRCDALNIDHDQCRRASIQLTHCDKCIMCDICGITFQSRKLHLNHKKCRRKSDYVHNAASPQDALKFRLRERELQLLEVSRLKKSSDYLDPVSGFSRTMQALTKNDELIIIPKMAPIQPSTAKIHFTPLNYNNPNNTNNNNNENNNIKNILGNKKSQVTENNVELTNEKLTSIILSCQNSINANNKSEKNNSLPSQQIKLSDHLNGAIVDIKKVPNSTNENHIKLTGLLSNNLNSVPLATQLQPEIIKDSDPTVNNVNFTLNQQKSTANISGLVNNKNFLVVPITELNSERSLLQAQGVPKFCVVPNKSSQSSTTPFKVVPIVELKSEPSLLHQTQGVPKFCVVPDKSVVMSPLTPEQKKKLKDKKKPLPLLLPKLVLNATQLLNSGKIRPLQPAISDTIRSANVINNINNPILIKKQKNRKRSRKKLLKKGKYKCTHCPKRFSSIEYCNLHIAKHENNPGFFCKLCEKGFLDKYILKKHFESEHKAGEVRCEMCNNVMSSIEELIKHMKTPEIKVKQQCSDCCECFDTCNNLDVHMRKEHGFLICTLCKRQVAKPNIKRHLMLEHSISKNRLETACDKLSYLPGENETVCEVSFALENSTTEIVKNELINEIKKNEIKIEPDCLARNRSVRRRSSKEFFICNICERRFENEKQFQIHLANNPMKFTPCPDCGKKFHRKSEYTEHSKTCGSKVVSPVEQSSPKRKKLSLQISLKSNDTPQNSIDKKKEITISSKCKKLKLNEEETVQKEDKASIWKSTVEMVTVLKQDSSDCLKMLNVIKERDNIEQSKNSECTKRDDTEVTRLNAKETEMDSNESAIFDKSIAVRNNFKHDHNYLAQH